MGEDRIDTLRVDFDRELRLEFHGAKVTSDAGLLAYRELDDVFGLTEAGGELLSDARTGANTQHTMTALLRQAVLGRLAGYEDHLAEFPLQFLDLLVLERLFVLRSAA